MKRKKNVYLEHIVIGSAEEDFFVESKSRGSKEIQVKIPKSENENDVLNGEDRIFINEQTKEEDEFLLKKFSRSYDGHLFACEYKLKFTSFYETNGCFCSNKEFWKRQEVKVLEISDEIPAMFTIQLD